MREPASRGNEWLVPSGPQFPYSVPLESPSHVESLVPGTVMKWKKQSGILKHFSPNAGIKCADVERQHQTHGINTHTNILRSPSFHQDFLFLSCMTRWNRETILIVFSQASLKLETNNKAGMLGFPELWRFFFFGNSSISFFNLIFYIFSFPCKAFKGKCSSTDKQVARFSRKSKYCWGWLEALASPVLTRHHCLEQNVLLAKTSQELYKIRAQLGHLKISWDVWESMQFPVFSLYT